jgi:hypothetical protein
LVSHGKKLSRTLSQSIKAGHAPVSSAMQGAKVEGGSSAGWPGHKYKTLVKKIIKAKSAGVCLEW